MSLRETLRAQHSVFTFLRQVMAQYGRNVARLVLGICFKVILANVLSSAVTTWARCEQTWTDKGLLYTLYEWSSLLRPCSNFQGFFVYNLVHGASFVQFVVLYTALRYHGKHYTHVLLCVVFMYAPILFGHHRLLPETFKQSGLYTHYTHYAELPALFFAFAAFQRATARTTTGVYGALVYWSLPELFILLGSTLVFVPFEHFGQFLFGLENLATDLTALLGKTLLFFVLHVWALFMDTCASVHLLMEWLRDTCRIISAEPPTFQTRRNKFRGLNMLTNMFDYSPRTSSKRSTTTSDR
ncbi:hypothetical protein C8T65DRAFT_826836 [Cerioporus squamosus]|nr:hypothetical protein C8T65DRAFT_826836 [Cerioporus squamosus]